MGLLKRILRKQRNRIIMSVTQKLSEITPTNSTRFILPMLGTSVLKDAFFVNNYYINTYIGDQHKKAYDDHILLFYKFEPTKEYVRFEKVIELLETYSDSYDHDQAHSTVYAFEVPERYQEDYNMFINGDYMLFSEAYKKQILSFWGLGGNNIITHILYGSTETGRRWPKPNMSIEIYS